jgi:RNase P/RNase MRP subunit p30
VLVISATWIKKKIGNCGPTWAKSETPSKKITKVTRARSMAQVVACLPSKLKVLRSNSSTTEIKIIRDTESWAQWHASIIPVLRWLR